MVCSIPGNCANRPSFTEILSIRNFQLPSLLSAMSAVVGTKVGWDEMREGVSLRKVYIHGSYEKVGRRMTCCCNDVFDFQKWYQSKFSF